MHAGTLGRAASGTGASGVHCSSSGPGCERSDLACSFEKHGGSVVGAVSGTRSGKAIPGIGKRTAAILAAKIVSIDRFSSPQKLVGFFGVFPEESSSGVDKVGRPLSPGHSRMSAKGNDLARGYLWMAAKSAVVHNPAIKPLYTRLRAKGKRSDVTLGHCARKLLHLVFAIWKTNQPFDPKHFPWTPEVSKVEETPHNQQEIASGPKQEIVHAEKDVSTAKTSVGLSHSVNNSKSSQSVDFAFLREQVTIEQVLRHLGHWEQLRGCTEMRGSCPFHSKSGSRSRTFSVNPAKNVFHCFGNQCNNSGNVLDFWAAYHHLSIHEAALQFAETFHLKTNREEEPVN